MGSASTTPELQVLGFSPPLLAGEGVAERASRTFSVCIAGQRVQSSETNRFTHPRHTRMPHSNACRTTTCTSACGSSWPTG
ncbi:hypothetical protein LUTEI9C_150014 [Luteimonas sp. 9C]|nr:hypothetical protein LUTEI9C_150014 [Luteimonas sp. 9C]